MVNEEILDAALVVLVLNLVRGRKVGKTTDLKRSRQVYETVARFYEVRAPETKTYLIKQDAQ